MNFKKLICKLLGHKYSKLDKDSNCECKRCKTKFHIEFTKWGELTIGFIETEIK